MLSKQRKLKLLLVMPETEQHSTALNVTANLIREFVQELALL